MSKADSTRITFKELYCRLRALLAIRDGLAGYNTGFASGGVTHKLGVLCSEIRPNAKPENVSGNCRTTTQKLNRRQKNRNMRKVIAAINMTLDGVCDHTVGIVDEKLHEHYSELINNAGVILYGRTTYLLMQFWQTLLHNPSGKKSMDDFASSINKIPKLVFSDTLKDTNWDSAELSDLPLIEKVLKLKQQSGNDILIGSRSLIIQLLNSNLIDEFQVCVHPIIEGKGLKLFDQITDRIMLKLINIKTLNSGATIFYYEPTRERTTTR